MIGQSWNSMSQGGMQVISFPCVDAAEPLQKWPVCLTMWRKKHEPDAATSQREPRSTIAGCWNPQTSNLPRKAVSPSSCADNHVTEIPLIQRFCWGQVITSLGLCLRNCSGQENVECYKLISWIVGQIRSERCQLRDVFNVSALWCRIAYCRAHSTAKWLIIHLPEGKSATSICSIAMAGFLHNDLAGLIKLQGQEVSVKKSPGNLKLT